ncbi:Hypothetical protein HDN1F_20070 [gamma proteobacterium HdN1]|nr:Hypothetical protein HDN1F_20070 [gamma proteobacterium HdN1]
MIGNPSSTNIGIFHEHGFYEDGSGDNVGFFGDDGNGHVGADLGYPNNKDLYERFGQHYDDGIMREAQDMIDSGNYDLLKNNCQSYADKLRDAYNDIVMQRYNARFGTIVNTSYLDMLNNGKRH